MDGFDAFGAAPAEGGDAFCEAAPATDAFGEPAPAADAFGAPVEPAPEATGGDPFGMEAPAAEEPAADFGVVEPAPEAAMEGFGDFGTSEPAAAEPVLEPAPVEAAAEEPAAPEPAAVDMMAGFGDDAFGAAPVAEVAPAADDLTGFEAPAAAPAADFVTNGDMFGTEAAPAPASAPLDFGMDGEVEEVKDPIVEWRNANREALEEKDRAEAQAKLSLQNEAQEYLTKFNETRTKRISEKVAKNREVESKSAEEARPMGATPWERVVSIIDFKFDPGRSKEVSRFKSVLFAAKSGNPGIAAQPVA